MIKENINMRAVAEHAQFTLSYALGHKDAHDRCSR